MHACMHVFVFNTENGIVGVAGKKLNQHWKLYGGSRDSISFAVAALQA